MRRIKPKPMRHIPTTISEIFDFPDPRSEFFRTLRLYGIYGVRIKAKNR